MYTYIHVILHVKSTRTIKSRVTSLLSKVFVGMYTMPTNNSVCMCTKKSHRCSLRSSGITHNQYRDPYCCSWVCIRCPRTPRYVCMPCTKPKSPHICDTAHNQYRDPYCCSWVFPRTALCVCARCTKPKSPCILLFVNIVYTLYNEVNHYIVSHHVAMHIAVRGHRMHTYRKNFSVAMHIAVRGRRIHKYRERE